MKILSIMIDMVRANRLKLFQPNLKRKNKLDNYLESIGGTVYTNLISQGPDTGRAMSSYFSGESPWNNGCDTRIKWPGSFLNSNLKTNIDLFNSYGYKQIFFSDPNARVALFPKEFLLHKYNNQISLGNFVEDINLSNDCHFFVALSDFHWGIDDFGPNLMGEKLGYSKTINSLSILFNKFEPNTFDYIFIFSDHGFKFGRDYKKEKKKNKLYLYNEDRVRPILFIREKDQKGIIECNKLITHSDIKNIYSNILKNKTFDVLDTPGRDFVCFEDHVNFLYSEFMNTEVFGLVNKKHLYIRNFQESLLLDRQGRFINNKKNEKYDLILENQTSYGKKLDYLKRLPNRYNLVCKPDFYSDGTKRFIRTNLIKNKLLKILKRVKI